MPPSLKNARANLSKMPENIFLFPFFSLKKKLAAIASVSYFRPSADSPTSSPGVDERVAGFWQSSADSSTSTSILTAAGGRGQSSGADDSGCHSPESMIQAPPINTRMSICSSCGKQITDPFIFRVSPNLEFHANCLKCCTCERELHDSCTAFVRNGQTFCRDDYLRLYAQPKCHRCQKLCDPNEMVMKVGNQFVYHIPCYSCFTCTLPLSPGERYYARDDEIYCRSECYAIAAAAATTSSNFHIKHDTMPLCGNSTTMLSTNGGNSGWEPLELHHQHHNHNHHNHSPQSIKSPDMISTSSTPNSLCMPLMPPQFAPSSMQILNTHNRSSISSSSNNSLGSMSVKKSKKDKPSTRVRTVLSETQLRTLKHMYSQNTRPDAVTKDHLVEATGLSARVIRVWFQNKRCKDKKRQTAMKEAQRTMEKEQALHGVRVNGIGPLIVEAASTDPNLDIAPLNIHQYPQNPGIWAQTCPDGNSPEMAQMPPPPYMMMNHGNYNEMPSTAAVAANGGDGEYGYGNSSGGYMPSGGPPDYSSLSSPSCSD